MILNFTALLELFDSYSHCSALLKYAIQVHNFPLQANNEHATRNFREVAGLLGYPGVTGSLFVHRQ